MNKKQTKNEFEKKIESIARDLSTIIRDNSEQAIKDQKITIDGLREELDSISNQIHCSILESKKRLKYFEKNEMTISKFQCENDILTLVSLTNELKPFCPYFRENMENLEEDWNSLNSQEGEE